MHGFLTVLMFKLCVTTYIYIMTLIQDLITTPLLYYYFILTFQHKLYTTYSIFYHVAKGTV